MATGTSFSLLQQYGSDSDSNGDDVQSSKDDNDIPDPDLNLHLKPISTDGLSASSVQTISVYSAPTVASKVLYL